MARWNIICKKWCRRLTGGFDPAASVAAGNQHLYEKETNGQPKIYGCTGEVGFQHEAPTKPYKCPKCNCPKNGSPAIEVDEVVENNFFHIDWCFDYYQVLRVKPKDSKGIIKKAYYKLVNMFRPDKLKDRSPTEQAANNIRLADFNKAWEMLNDDNARQRYNAAYEYMAFQCPGCITPGIKRSNPNTCVRSSSSLRYFHSKECARAWNQANSYSPVSVHGWTEPGKEPPKPKKNTNSLPKRRCAGCQNDKPFSRHFWVRWSENSTTDYCCTEKCLFDYWTKQGKYPNGKPVYQCYFCGTVKKENNSTTWVRETDQSSKVYNLVFCSLEHLREAEAKAEMGLGSFGSGSGDPNINKKRQEFIQELVGLDGWDKLSDSEQNDFVSEVNRSQPGRFPAIKARVLAAISQKDGGGDPLQATKNAAITEIDGKLLEEPEIKTQELETSNQNWGDDIQNATSESQIKQIKDKVLADIKRKRQAKKQGGGGDKGKSVDDLRQEAINQIRAELEKQPPVAKSELTNQNWEIDLAKAKTENAIKEIRDRVLVEIQSKRATKQEENRLQELLAQAKQEENWNNYEKLEAILQQIKKLFSSDAYREKEAEIQEVESQLQQLNPDKYKGTQGNLLDQQVKDNGLTDSNMDEETKQALAAAKQDPTKEKVALAGQKIAQNGANNKLNKLVTQISNRLKRGKLSKKEKTNMLTELLQFINKNHYQKNSYAKQKHVVDKLLAELQDEKTHDNTQNPPFWKKALVPLLIISLLGIVITSVLIWRRKKIRKINS